MKSVSPLNDPSGSIPLYFGGGAVSSGGTSAAGVSAGAGVGGAGAGGAGSTDTYAVVSLSAGQTLSGQVGCEILLRVGSAQVSASESPGLVDTTDASSLSNGSALKANHLYLVSIGGNGIKATSAAKVIVRGDYSIK